MREEGFLYLYQSYHPGVFPEKKRRNYGFFQLGGSRITDPCHRAWRRLRHLGAINLLEGYGNDNPGAKSSPPGTTRFAWSQA